MMAQPASRGDNFQAQQYAPHPGELSGETWPMSMADMTEELLGKRNNRSRHQSLIHSSAYDNRAEAAAGAAALIHGANSAYNAPGAYPHGPSPAMASAPLERSPPVPAMASPPITAGGLQNQQHMQFPAQAQRRSQAPPPLRLPMSPFLADGFVLPSVVLTPPPDDEIDGPVTLYPRASPQDSQPANDRGFYSPPPLASQPAVPSPPRSASLPHLPQSSMPPVQQKQQQQPPAPEPARVMGFAKPTPKFGRRYSSQVAALVMPKTAEQVKSERQAATAGSKGGRFDAEWNELVEELPSPGSAQANGAISNSNTPKMGSPLPFPTRPAPAPPAQNIPQVQQRQQPQQYQQHPQPPQQQRSASAPVRSAPVSEPQEQARPETPKSVKSLKLNKDKQAKESRAATPTQSNPKSHRRRSLSLSALFSRNKKPNFDDLPPMPGQAQRPETPQTPKSPKTPKTPKSPKSAPVPEDPTTPKSEKRKTLLKRASLKDLFGTASSSDRKAPRKTKSKPELYAGNRLVDDNAPPVPALPKFTATQNQQVVPDALAALTANSKGSASAPAEAHSAPAGAAVEMVPDVFAAFNSSQTSLQLRGVSAQLNGIAPSNPKRAESPSPFANFEHSTEFNASQQAMYARQNGSATALTGKTSEPSRSSPLAQGHQVPQPPTTKQNPQSQKQPNESDKDDDDKARRRTKSLSKRLSISSLFTKKKKDTEPAPEMPALPATYQRTVSQQQQPPPRQPTDINKLPKALSSQDILAARPVSPMVNNASAENLGQTGAKQARGPTTSRVPVPRMETAPATNETSAPAMGVNKAMPAPPQSGEPEGPSSMVKKAPDASLSRGPLPPAIAATQAKLRGESSPLALSQSPPTMQNGILTEEDDSKRQSRREHSIHPSPSSEYLRQQNAAIGAHQQAQAKLVNQLRSVSEPVQGPTRSASEQSFQQAVNPFAEQAPSAEVIQQAAALVCKPAPMTVVQKAEAAYLNKRKEQEQNIEKLDDETAVPNSWATFNSEPKTQRTAPLKITKKASLDTSSSSKDTLPLRIEKKVRPDGTPETPTSAGSAGAAVIIGAAAAGATAVNTSVKSAGDGPHSSSPQYTENPSFSFPPKPKEAGTLIQPPKKIRRVSVPALQPQSLNSPHAAIPTPIPEAGGPFSDSSTAVKPAPAPAAGTAPADLTAANAKLEAAMALAPAQAPVINIITATPLRTPTASHEGTMENEEVEQRDVEIVSPVLSEASPAVVATAVRTSIFQSSPEVLTSTTGLAQAVEETDERDASATIGSPSDSDYSLPALESPPPISVGMSNFTRQQASPSDDSFGPSANATPTKSSGMPAMLGSAFAAAAAAATAAVACAVGSEKKPEEKPELEEKQELEENESEQAAEHASRELMTSPVKGLAYLDGSSTDTHQSFEVREPQTPVSEDDGEAPTPLATQVVPLSLAPVRDELPKTPVATANSGDDTPTVGGGDDMETPKATSEAGIHVAEAAESEVEHKDRDSPDTIKVAPVDEERKRSESVPPPEKGSAALVPGSQMSLPARLSVSPVAAADGSALPTVQRSSIFAMVKSAVSSAFAEASDTLDEIDATIEKTVKSTVVKTSPSLTNVTLPAAGAATAAETAAGTSSAAPSAFRTSSRAGSAFSGRRTASSDDGMSIYTTPMSDMDGEYFDSPSASTTSFETAASNATISPVNSKVSLPFTPYSNSARPPSMMKFNDLPPVIARPEPQRRGSMPAALAKSAERRRNPSSPLPGSSELPSAPTMPSVPGPRTHTFSRQGMRSATMPAPRQDIADGQTELTPPIFAGASIDGHGSEESSSFHLDTDTIQCESPVDDFASLPDSPMDMQMSSAQRASSMYVVPFSPEMHEAMPQSEARTQTSSNYVSSSGIREHVRRVSGGLRDVVSTMGFTKVARDESTQRSSGVDEPSTVDYSAPSGLGMWHSRGSVEEITEQGFQFRRRLDDPDVSLDSVSYASSGSDDHEGSPRTPRTPDLDALVTPSVLPMVGVGLGINVPGSPSPLGAGDLKKGTTITRTREPFRALHVDMSADHEETMTSPTPNTTTTTTTTTAAT